MHVVRWILLCSIAIAAAACGGDKSSDSKPSAATGAAGGYVPMDVACGGVVCKPFYGPGLNAPLEACCADQFSKTCGVQTGSSCAKAPPVHPTCPSAANPIGVSFGCCTDNKCGLTGGFFGQDCVSLEDLNMSFAMPMGMGMGGMSGMGMGMGRRGGPPGFNLPQPQACQ